MRKGESFFHKGAAFFLFLVFSGAIIACAQDDAAGGRNAPSGMSQGVQPPQTEEGRREMKAPPKEAIEACAGKKPSDVCECNGPRGVMKGTCEYTPDKKYFACRPDNMRPPDKRPDNQK